MDNISLVTYAGQTVTPLDDALVYETAINQSGMIYGGTVTIKSANNLHISSGHGIVCGRKFTIFDSDIQVALSSSGTLLGRLYVQLDLSNVGTPIQLLVETGASLTPVQQDNNVNIMNGVFEFNIATFTVDTSTISNVIMVAPSAEPSTGAGSVITVTTAEASLAGKMCTITDGTTTLNANFDNTGKAVFYGVQMVGRVLVNATDGEYYASGEVNITYFGLYSTSIAFWGATINLSTTTPEFYGQNITVKQDGILVSTISFDGTGHATYIAPALGVYDFTVTYGGNEYTATVNVTEETTYSKSIDIAPAGLDLSAWITAGSTTDYPLNPSSYPTFADLEADEAAVRQLMTVHASVDYLAQATAGDSLMESVIGSDVCAKWINDRDYALDTLYANSDIADVMDTADKYGYGEWGIIDSTTTPPTWGALGNVPIMTANNAPYGVAICSSYASSLDKYNAWRAFDNVAFSGGNNHWESSMGESNSFIGYIFPNPVSVHGMSIVFNYIGSSLGEKTFKLQGSNDTTNGSDGTWEDIATFSKTFSAVSAWTNLTHELNKITADFKKALRLICTTGSIYLDGNTLIGVDTLQFYGRELKPLVPTMTGTNTPKGEVVASTYDSRFSAPYYVFSGSVATAETQGWYSGDHGDPASIGYIATEPMHAKLFVIRNRVTSTANQVYGAYQFTLEGYNGTTWETTQTYEDANNTSGAYRYFGIPAYADEYTGLRINFTAGASGQYQTDATWITMLQFYGMDYSEKEFAAGSTRKTIYDHGVELETIGTSDTSHKDAGALVISCGASSANNTYGLTYGDTVDMSGYNAINAVVGRKAASSAQYIQVQAQTGISSYNDGRKAYQAFGNGNKYLSLDITSVMESARPTLTTNASSLCEIVEWWLE